MSSNKNRKKGSPAGALLGVFVLFVMGMISEADGDFGDVIWAVAGLVIMVGVFAVIYRTVAAVKKNGGQSAASPYRPGQTGAARSHVPGPAFPKPAFRTHTGGEEAIHCGHSRGRQKYLEQLDSFLANGIIEKDEYRLLRERYEKLDIADDYH